MFYIQYYIFNIMRQILSFVLLLLMLIAGIQPTMAMHFCGNNLHLISLFEKENCTFCSIDTPSKDVAPICCNRFSSESRDLIVTSESCCTDHQIELSTDQFHNQERFTVCNTIYPTINGILYFVPSRLDILKINAQQNFNLEYPPKGFEYLNVDILTAISTLII